MLYYFLSVCSEFSFKLKRAPKLKARLLHYLVDGSIHEVKSEAYKSYQSLLKSPNLKHYLCIRQGKKGIIRNGCGENVKPKKNKNSRNRKNKNVPF